MDGRRVSDLQQARSDHRKEGSLSKPLFSRGRGASGAEVAEDLRAVLFCPADSRPQRRGSGGRIPVQKARLRGAGLAWALSRL